MTTYVLDIANDFSKFPAGRYTTDGKFSGERFRDDFLVPKLKDNDKVTVVIDGVKGYGSSFLEEAFGGLIRKKYFTAKDINEKLDIKFSNQAFKSYMTEILEYIKDA